MTEYHEDILRQLQAKAVGAGLQIPSMAFSDSGGCFVDYVPMRSLIAEFPVPSRAAGMDNTVEWGWISNVLQHTTAALAFLVSATPCTPVTINMNCIRPMSTLHGPVTVEAKLRNRSRALVYAEAKVISGESRTVATGAITYTVGLYQRD
jgi:acyl-coenzyme A thioesterase PaaI-like protein